MNTSRPRPFDLDDFTFLGRDGDRGVAFGLTGAFWQTDYGLVEVRSAEEFVANDRVDVCWLVMGFVVEAGVARAVVLSTETRMFCPTDEVRRRFAPYWYLIRPVSGLIRRRMLGRIREEVEGLVGAS